MVKKTMTELIMELETNLVWLARSQEMYQEHLDPIIKKMKENINE